MNSPQAAPDDSPRARGIGIVHAAFVLNGAITTMLAPALPILAARWSLSDSQAGQLFTVQFLGSMTGNIICSWLAPRRGLSAALGTGYLLMASGVAALSLAAWPAALVCAYVYGIGVGLTIPSSNVFIAEASGARAGAALNILNFAWTAGAIACPWLFAFARGEENANLLLRVFAVLAVVSAAAMVRTRGISSHGAERVRIRLSEVEHSARAFFTLSVLFFLYIGTEAALVGWISTYSERLGSGSAGAVAASSFFWAAVLLTRLAAPTLLNRYSETAAARIGLTIAIFGTAIVLAGKTLAVVIAGLTVTGLGLAMVFPLILSYMYRRFGAAAARAASLLYIVGGLGGACLPWLVGLSSTHLGSLAAGMALPGIAMVLMLIIHAAAVPASPAKAGS